MNHRDEVANHDDVSNRCIQFQYLKNTFTLSLYLNDALLFCEVFSKQAKVKFFKDDIAEFSFFMPSRPSSLSLSLSFSPSLSLSLSLYLSLSFSLVVLVLSINMYLKVKLSWKFISDLNYW